MISLISHYVVLCMFMSNAMTDRSWDVWNIEVPDDWGLQFSEIDKPPIDTRAWEESLTSLPELAKTESPTVKFKGLDLGAFPEPTPITGVVNLKLSDADQPTTEDLEASLIQNAKAYSIHPDDRRHDPRHLNLWEKTKRFARKHSIGKVAGRLSLATAITVSALFVSDGGSSKYTEQKDITTTSTQTDQLTTATKVANVPEAEPAVAIKKSLPNLSQAAESTPQVITLRVTEEDNSLWKAADSALSILPQYQDIPVPDKAIADAVRAAVYLKTAPQNPDRVFPGDEILTVASN